MLRFRRNSLIKIVICCFFLFFLVNLLIRSKTSNNLHITEIDNSKAINDERLVLPKRDLVVIKTDPTKYILELSENRINRLFDIIHQKEIVYGPILDSLNLVSFNSFIENKNNVPAFKDFKSEVDEFLIVNDNRVRATKSFINYLYNKSDEYSFKHPRSNVEKSKIIKDEEKPVIVTAANSAYYDALQATVYHVHQHFADYKLIVYDLGLGNEAHQTTVQNCKCEVKKFDLDGAYSKVSPHITDLKTYAWKPLLIQETLKEHKTVIYIDSSIRFHSNEISPVISALRDVGMLTQFIGLKLNCYTNPKMFDWFGEKAISYESFFTVEANILFFHQSFLTSLIMKAWVTCALDKNCIAPIGSSIGGCCGCHRFDQDAITIVNSFFYGHPKDSKNYLPAYSFTTQESYFFQIRRYEGKNYFKKE